MYCLKNFWSTLSAWEIAIKKSLNKLLAPSNLKEVVESNDIDFIPMKVEHALYVEHLPAIHHDPFDRLLIAQCTNGSRVASLHSAPRMTRKKI